jgi:hypothetical protein
LSRSASGCGAKEGFEGPDALRQIRLKSDFFIPARRAMVAPRPFRASKSQGNSMTIFSALRRAIAAVSFLLVLSAGFSGSANAGDVSFIMKNGHPNAVEVELYSQARDHVWPGGDEVYLLDDGESKEISLSCEEGESICYGAWISGDETTYWGTGPNNAQKCDNCCYTCTGGETEEINLIP